MTKKQPSNIKIITKNKKAFFQYHIDEKFEAGISLIGSEVKSLREGRANLVDSYGLIKAGELFLLHAHIAQYQPAGQFNHEPRRTRKLLVHRKELQKIEWKLKQKGLTLIPTMLYFKKGKAKVEIALAHGKKKYDKREAIKKRETKRALGKAMRRR